MKRISLHLVDVFTGTVFGGNTAGVVRPADGLTVEEMGLIARGGERRATGAFRPVQLFSAEIEQ
jgi:predicted PhzF superfamily epimerase YddE/YHI9